MWAETLVQNSTLQQSKPPGRQWRRSISWRPGWTFRAASLRSGYSEELRFLQSWRPRLQRRAGFSPVWSSGSPRSRGIRDDPLSPGSSKWRSPSLKKLIEKKKGGENLTCKDDRDVSHQRYITQILEGLEPANRDQDKGEQASIQHLELAVDEVRLVTHHLVNLINNEQNVGYSYSDLRHY